MSRALDLSTDAIDIWFEDEAIPALQALIKDGYDIHTRELAIIASEKILKRPYPNLMTWLNVISDKEYVDFYDAHINKNFNSLIELEQLARDINTLEAKAHQADGILNNKRSEEIRALINSYLEDAIGADVHNSVLELGKKEGLNKIKELRDKLIEVIKNNPIMK